MKLPARLAHRREALQRESQATRAELAAAIGDLGLQLRIAALAFTVGRLLGRRSRWRSLAGVALSLLAALATGTQSAGAGRPPANREP